MNACGVHLDALERGDYDGDDTLCHGCAIEEAEKRGHIQGLQIAMAAVVAVTTNPDIPTRKEASRIYHAIRRLIDTTEGET